VSAPPQQLQLQQPAPHHPPSAATAWPAAQPAAAGDGSSSGRAGAQQGALAGGAASSPAPGTQRCCLWCSVIDPPRWRTGPAGEDEAEGGTEQGFECSMVISRQLQGCS
jgi:hypothetical protein